jgi:PAS domain S-box-containing protein
MRKLPLSPEEAALLRRRAEEQFKLAKVSDAAERSVVETARLVHELEVHQIELEMQNQELQLTRDRIEELLARYTDLYDYAPAGYLTFDPEGSIRQMNQMGARMLGHERSKLVKRNFALFLAEADRQVFRDFLKRAYGSQTKITCEVAVLRADGPPLVVLIEATRSEGGQELRAVVLDISERRRAEQALKEKNVLLEEALAKVKLLSGLLPICSSCKKIRDDKGYWSQVENYIEKHSQATFTHGLCPGCVQAYFPDIKGDAAYFPTGNADVD